MEKVIIADKTLKQDQHQLNLSFREKIELCRLIDSLGVDVIELPAIENLKTDSLLIKSVSAVVREARIAVPVTFSPDSVKTTWFALRETRQSLLQVSVPVSSVQMEYLSHLKPSQLLDKTIQLIHECLQYTPDVELILTDCSRGEQSFIQSLMDAAAREGIRRITFSEATGEMLPEEMSGYIHSLIENTDRQFIFGIDCSNSISLADACVVESLRSGIREIKTAAYALDCASLENVVRIIHSKGEHLGARCDVRPEKLRRTISQIENLCKTTVNPLTPFENGVREQDNFISLSIHDSRESIDRAMDDLGYSLSQEDRDKIYRSFLSVAEKKKGSLSLREMDAIIASEAMQVPPAYQIISYVINTGNVIGAMAHMKIRYLDKTLEGISAGDGAIDAAFLAIEQAVGKHFELDDFQIQAVTEGKEAMGETIVRLRSQGKLYSGRGLSTDIVGAGVMAYINALNKIVYEEEAK